MKRKISRKMYGKAAGLVIGIAAVMCICSVEFYAMADTETTAGSENGPYSNLWLSVVDLSSAPRISVTVPTAYSFMVTGTTETADTRPVTVENGGVQLGRSVVWDAEKGAYDIIAEKAEIEFQNYSTSVVEQEAGKRVRTGIRVTIRGHIGADPIPLIGGTDTWWQPVAADPTGDTGQYKCYRMGIGGAWFEIPDTVTENGEKRQVLYLNGGLTLDAPDVETGGCNVGGTANVPCITSYPVDLQVGGVRNHYNVPEESAKAGRIVWEVNLPQ